MIIVSNAIYRKLKQSFHTCFLPKDVNTVSISSIKIHGTKIEKIPWNFEFSKPKITHKSPKFRNLMLHPRTLKRWKPSTDFFPGLTLTKVKKLTLRSLMLIEGHNSGPFRGFFLPILRFLNLKHLEILRNCMKMIIWTEDCMEWKFSIHWEPFWDFENSLFQIEITTFSNHCQ